MEAVYIVTFLCEILMEEKEHNRENHSAYSLKGSRSSFRTPAQNIKKVNPEVIPDFQKKQLPFYGKKQNLVTSFLFLTYSAFILEIKNFVSDF